MTIQTIFVLLVVYQLKHMLADYVLQSHTFFIGKFNKDWSFFKPMFVHVLIHGYMTWLIAGGLMHVSLKASGLLALFDGTVHFFMDRLKAGAKYMGRWKALSGNEFPNATPAQLRSNALFWNALGLDQMVHHLTHYVIIYVIVVTLRG